MIARDGYGTIAVVLGVALAFGGLAGWLPDLWSLIVRWILLLPVLLVLWFFRDPDRISPDGDGLILSPADGRIVLIRDVEEPEYMNGSARQISIFLSPLNVHVNRIPANGDLEYVQYHPGNYLMAWDEHASEKNERAHFGLLLSNGKRMLFKQITGFLARRIVYRIGEGDHVRAGERFGIMKFGSRMDLLLPPDIELEVSVGEKTVAGKTIIGRIPA
ncbi:MAG: phosphatidylserine decarboxylase family protein [Balneolaceae bacterium]